MKLGFIGLGKMGSRMVGKLIWEGHELVVWNRSQAAIEEFKSQNSIPIRSGSKVKNISQNLKVARTIKDLVLELQSPRIIWLMLPAHSTSSGQAGSPTEEVLDEVSKYVEKDDIIIDGGNSNYKDTQERFENFSKNGIRFLGIGVSGGIIAAKEGYPIMVGGSKEAYEHIIPILGSLSKPHGGHQYFGEGGAGHFVKMIHNGIEYGIMQSLGEGFEVLEKAPYSFDLLSVARLWQKGTLVSGFMLDRAVEVLEKDKKLESIDGIIAESGEARWTVDQASEEGVRVEIIERSLDFRRRSQSDKSVSSSFTAKMVAALRNAFGGHSVRHPSAPLRIKAQGKEVKKKD